MSLVSEDGRPCLEQTQWQVNPCHATPIVARASNHLVRFAGLFMGCTGFEPVTPSLSILSTRRNLFLGSADDWVATFQTQRLKRSARRRSVCRSDCS
jgi:hypothetical protein